MSDNNQSNNKTTLEIVEIVSILASFGGSIASVMSQQVIIAALPLSITAGLSFINRQKRFEKVENLLTEQLELHQEKFDSNLQEQQKWWARIEENNSKITPIPNSLREIQNQIYELKDKDINSLENHHKELQEFVFSLKEVVNLSQTAVSSSDSGESNYQRGLNNEKIGNKEAAIQDYTAAIKLNKNHAEAFYHRGVIFAQIGIKQQAVDDLRQAAKLFLEKGDMSHYQEAKDASKNLHQLTNNTQNSDNQAQMFALEKLLS